MAVKKYLCELCGAEISASNFSKHLRRHEEHPETFDRGKYKLTHDGLDCQFCGSSFTTRNGLCNHERQCKQNPNRQQLAYTSFDGYNASRKAGDVITWNKGLTKATDERLANRGKVLSERYASGELKPAFAGRRHSEATKAKLSAIAVVNQLGGHPYRKKIEYNGVSLDSNLELLLAQRLDELNIKWERCGRFPYIDANGKKHTYTPDFYLPDYNIYLDPKNDFLINSINPALGYKDTDKINWVMEQNNITVLVLNKEQVAGFDIDTYLGSIIG